MHPASGDKPTFSFPDMRGEEKLRELILFIADRCVEDPTFGRTKLNKILLRAERDHYLSRGRPLTGLPYMHQPHGPVPRRMLPVMNDMEASGEIKVRQRSYHSHVQKRVLALREANLDKLAADDIAFVTAAIEDMWGKTAREVSDESHGRAWRMTTDGVAIPYEAFFISDEPLTEYDIARAHELIKEHGWDVQ